MADDIRRQLLQQRTRQKTAGREQVKRHRMREARRRREKHASKRRIGRAESALSHEEAVEQLQQLPADVWKHDFAVQVPLHVHERVMLVTKRYLNDIHRYKSEQMQARYNRLAMEADAEHTVAMEELVTRLERRMGHVRARLRKELRLQDDAALQLLRVKLEALTTEEKRMARSHRTIVEERLALASRWQQAKERHDSALARMKSKVISRRATLKVERARVERLREKMTAREAEVAAAEADVCEREEERTALKEMLLSLKLDHYGRRLGSFTKRGDARMSLVLDGTAAVLDASTQGDRQMMEHAACGSCHDMGGTPLLLWPCGHTFCSSCLGVVEGQSVEQRRLQRLLVLLMRHLRRRHTTVLDLFRTIDSEGGSGVLNEGDFVTALLRLGFAERMSSEMLRLMRGDRPFLSYKQGLLELEAAETSFARAKESGDEEGMDISTALHGRLEFVCPSCPEGTPPRLVSAQENLPMAKLLTHLRKRQLLHSAASAALEEVSDYVELAHYAKSRSSS
eukprot:PLAT4269.1.p1 GENE.PLAT4269.1~~PLAT4269.1.p1  ORF type:complete len:570 (-),score=209.87 PLAT4269.1:39-1577(-)